MEDRTLYFRDYRERRKLHIAASQKKYREGKKSKLAAYQELYYAKNRSKLLIAAKMYYSENKEKHAIATKAYRVRHREEVLEKGRNYYKQNAASINLKTALRVRANPEVRRRIARNYMRRLRLTPQGRLDSRISRSISKCLRGKKGGVSWTRMVEYTPQQLTDSIGSKFTKGMTWEKLIAGEIHIDHKIPKSKFRYSSHDDIEFKRCWALDNLQPMWAADNLAKGNKIECPSQISIGA